MIRQQVKDIRLSIRKISQKAAEQEDCVRLDIGQPSFDTPEHIKQAAREGIDQKQGYSPMKGMAEMREKAAEEESMKKGVSMDRENILVTAGGMAGLYGAIASTVEEKAVFNDPCWGPYKLISEVNGNDWTQVNYFNEDGLRQEARKEIKDADLVIVNSPNNPTGRMLEKQDAREIAEFAEDHGTLLLSDEVYHRLTYDREHVSPARFTEDSLILGSTSKNHAMTGWRLGWIAADEEYVEEIAKAERAMNAAPPRVSQYAAIEAIENDSHVEEMRSEYDSRRKLLMERMDRLDWDYVTPHGSIYSFPDVGKDSWEFCMEMIEHGVAMVPGEPSGPESDTNVRICFGSSTEEEIKTAFDRLEDAL